MGDICGMSSLPISPEQLATLPPDVRAVIEAIVRHYEERIARLEAELQGLRKTPQNSSLPPSTQHPHAKPLKPRSKSKKKHGGQPGHAKRAGCVATRWCANSVRFRFVGEGNRMTKVQDTAGKGMALTELGSRWDNILLLRNPASSRQLAGPPRRVPCCPDSL